MRFLIPLFAFVAYREAFRFSAERARELDAVDVERWFFIPDETAPVIVFAMAAWLLYRRWPRLQQVAWRPGPWWTTAPLLATGTSVFAWSTYAGAPDLLAVSLCINSFGLASLLGGAQAMRVVAVPALFVLFAIPLPAPLLSSLVWNFQIWTADYAGWLLYMIGQPAFVSGDQILRPHQAFQVIEACSGLRSVETLAMLTVLMIDLFGRRGWHAALLLALVPVVAFGLNGLRVLTLILNPHSDIAAVHNLQGIVVLLTGLTLLYVIDGVIGRVLTPAPRKPLGPPCPPTPTSMRAAAAGFAGLAAMSFAMPVYRLPPDPQPLLADHLTEQLGDWEAVADLRIDARFLERIGIRQNVFRRYVRPRTPAVELFVATGHHGNRFRSPFSPKSALPGSGWLTEHSDRVELADGVVADAKVLRKGTDRLLVYHWYEETEGLLDESVRTMLALDTSPLRRPREAVLVRMSTPLPSYGDVDLMRGERRLRRFHEVMRPGLDDYGRLREGAARAPEVAKAG